MPWSVLWNIPCFSKRWQEDQGNSIVPWKWWTSRYFKISHPTEASEMSWVPQFKRNHSKDLWLWRGFLWCEAEAHPFACRETTWFVNSTGRSYQLCSSMRNRGLLISWLFIPEFSSNLSCFTAHFKTNCSWCGRFLSRKSGGSFSSDDALLQIYWSTFAYFKDCWSSFQYRGVGKLGPYRKWRLLNFPIYFGVFRRADKMMLIFIAWWNNRFN